MSTINPVVFHVSQSLIPIPQLYHLFPVDIFGYGYFFGFGYFYYIRLIFYGIINKPILGSYTLFLKCHIP